MIYQGFRRLALAHSLLPVVTAPQATWTGHPDPAVPADQQPAALSPASPSTQVMPAAHSGTIQPGS